MLQQSIEEQEVYVNMEQVEASYRDDSGDTSDCIKGFVYVVLSAVAIYILYVLFLK